MAPKKQTIEGEEMSWISRKLFLYNVTFGLYALDWWERYLFNTILLVLLWFICYNSGLPLWQAFESNLKSNMHLGRGNYSMVAH